MIQILLPTIIIVAISIFLLSIGILIKGKFVNMHISGNKAMQRHKVSCATTQDAEARMENKHAVAEQLDI